MYQQRRAEEVLVAQGQRTAVGGKVHDQRPHYHAVVLHRCTREGIDVGHEGVAEADGSELLVKGPLPGLPEAVDFGCQRARGVVAHDRDEYAPLHPAYLQLPEGGIVSPAFIEPVEEAADIGVPVRNSAEGIVQS